jgi:hypothetical protein
MTSTAASPDENHRRAFARLRVGVGARFETLHGAQAVRLTDLSQGGAQVILSRPDEAGPGVLTWLGYEAFGELAWREDDTIGLTFDTLLAPGCLAQTRLQAPSVVRDEELGESLAKAWVSGEIADD